MYINLKTKEKRDKLPKKLKTPSGVTYSPNDKDGRHAGWYPIEYVAVPSGHVLVNHRYDVGGDVAVESGELVTQAEYDALIATQAAASAQAVQDAKSDSLKEAENNFFTLCATIGLAGKPDFSTISAAIDTIKETDFATATELALKLLAIDAQAKREGGLDWWDSAAVHELPE